MAKVFEYGRWEPQNKVRDFEVVSIGRVR
jgi:hypothetical protein